MPTTSTELRNRLAMKPTKLNFLLGIFASLLLAIAATGCNTADGIGDDVEEAGDEIEEALD
jgi:predicted small secreted protein